MNVLLIYPQNPETFWSFKHVLKYIKRKSTFPPLGLLTIASVLPEEWNLKLIDENVREITDENIEWADLIFISAMIVQKTRAQEIINHCKTFNKTVVVGGPVFTTQPNSFHNIDHYILNEAEITLPVFLEDFKKGKAKKIYSSNEKPDITQTQLPKWDLIDFKDYSTMAVQYSRGCPFNCEFCDIVIMNGRKPRTKSNNQMILEMEELYIKGWRGSVFIVDDNFIGNKTTVKKMLPRLIKWQRAHKYPFKFITEASMNLADDPVLMRLMSLANFHKVFLGIETPKNESLKECGKAQNTNRNLAESVQIIQQNGMQVMGGFIVGFDNDTDNIFEAQIKFIQQTGVVTAMVGVLTALPQTRLWHRLKEEGRLLEDSSGENTDGNVNFIPKMGRDKLMDGYAKLMSTIYSPHEYYKRIHTFVNNYKPTVRSKLMKKDIYAFFSSIIKIGLISRQRFLYWKLIIRTLFKRTKALPEVIEMAICCLHFERISKSLR
ncbi:B12-binding domain-containing radical SAM protein [Nanoarchaeota archaeon]